MSAQLPPRILAFVEDPGAANGVVGMREALAARGVELRLVAAGAAAPYLEGKVTIDGAIESADALLDRHAPTALLVGTSENVETVAHALVASARARGVPSAGFVDGYPNAALRFKGTTADPLAHCPDRLLVPDAWTRDAFAALGIDASLIDVTGHPHYDVVLAKRAALESEGRSAVRARTLAKDPGVPVVVFAAEVSTGLDGAQFQRSSAYTLEGRNDSDDRTVIVLEEVLDALRGSGAHHLVLRLHPKNTRDEFASCIAEVGEVSSGGSALDVVFAADLVVGMTSMILVEAALVGRPTLSVVPRSLEADWLPTIRAGITPCASTRAELRSMLARGIARDPDPIAPFAVPGAVERMAAALAALALERSLP